MANDRTWARDEIMRYAVAQGGLDFTQAQELVLRCVAQELLRRDNTAELLPALRREARRTGRKIDIALRRFLTPDHRR